MLKARNFARTLIGGGLTAAVMTAALPLSASAWQVNYSAKSVCKDNSAVVNWTFTNTEPKGAQWSMNVEFSDVQTGGKAVKTVNPGETVNGSFTSAKTKLSNGSVTIKMLWTDGRSGVDTRTTAYQATPECYVKPFVVPTFKASVVCTVKDNKAVYTLNVSQTTGDAKLTFTPANGTTLPNGNVVEVTGSYMQDGASKTVTVKTEKVSDCTPELPKAPEQPKAAVQAAVTQLPNTGSGNIAGLIAGLTFVGAFVAAQIKMRRSVR